MCTISCFLHDFKSINLNAFLHISIMTLTRLRDIACKLCDLCKMFKNKTKSHAIFYSQAERQFRPEQQTPDFIPNRFGFT